METTVVFLERLRARYGGVSDYKLGQFLGVTTTGITNYMKHGRTMDDKIAIRLAHLLDLDPAYVVACMHAERATDVETSKLWTEIAAKFAASVLFAVPLMSLIHWRF